MLASDKFKACTEVNAEVDAEKIAEAALRYVFTLAFPASPLSKGSSSKV